MAQNYKKTLTACYLGFITQAVTANFAPLLFLRFHKEYQISLGSIALISTIFFLTQLFVDILCSYFADRIGYRKCVVASELCAAAGLAGLAFLPDLLPHPLAGIITSVIIYAIGSGLIEVLCSPIVEACPFAHKEAVMSLLQIPLFWISIILMVCAGASELSMAQWASAYAESALGLSKAMGDLAGPCMFAITMGISRVIFGKYGSRMDLMKFMTGSGCLCLLCYLLSSISDNPVLGLAGCMLCGFSVGIMWPGTISICSAHLPGGGTAMFGLLAMAGDLGGACGPGLVGSVTQHADNNLKAGMLTGCLFPLVLLISLFLLKNMKAKLSQPFAPDSTDH